MSQENVELARRVVDAVNRRDLGALLAMMDPDVEAGSLLVAVEGGYHGHDGIRRWWGNLLGAFPDYTIEVLELRAVDDWTLANVNIHGHGAGSRMPFELTVWLAAQWQRTKCVTWRAFDRRDEALEAVGGRGRQTAAGPRCRREQTPSSSLARERRQGRAPKLAKASSKRPNESKL